MYQNMQATKMGLNEFSLSLTSNKQKPSERQHLRHKKRNKMKQKAEINKTGTKRKEDSYDK